uniref:Uncharacterized protein n=1 Tax=Strongyloides venezuelensis TaxID=75913 RepID=A0A0K0EYY4_STRVS
MRYYENLKYVSSTFRYSLYDRSLEEDFKVFGNIQSLNNLKKVVGFELTFIKHHDGISKYKIEICHTNVKYLIQLLPKSVEGLQLFGIPNLNHDFTRTFKNIRQILKFCLSVMYQLKKLIALVF